MHRVETDAGGCVGADGTVSSRGGGKHLFVIPHK